MIDLENPNRFLMPPIGDTLRRERLRRNLELPQIAQELKISSRILQAIEEERFDKLPATVFAKNFVRQYALLLGLDGEELALQAQRLLEVRTVAPEFPPAFKPDLPEIPLDNVKPWDASGAGRGSGSSWIAAAALFVAAMLVCSAAYWWWERPHQQTVAHVVKPPAPKVAEQPAAAVNSGATPASTSAARSETPVETGVAQQSPAPTTATPAVATPAPPAAESNPNAAVRVEITAIDAVWVRARVNGKYLFSVTLQPHQTRNVDTDGAVELLLGNAGGASIALNGKPLSLVGFPSGTIGPKGQVRVVQLTSGGFQMVPSKPPDPRDR
jgi:cytoskeleton protein RodZ